MKKFAVLIDADNSSHRSIEPILEEIAKYGIFGRFWAVFKLFSLNSSIFLAIASYGREAAIGGGEMCLLGAIRPSGCCEMPLAMWRAGCSGAARSGCTATGQGACSVCFES